VRQPEQIVRTEIPLDEIGERLMHYVPPCQVERGAVDDDGEDAVAGVGGELEPGFLRRRIVPLGVGRPGIEGDELGGFDCLRLAVLENLEVVSCQPPDRAAVVVGGIGVDADVVSAAAKDGRPLRRPLRRLLRRLLRRGHRGREGDQEDASRERQVTPNWNP
jgi:hypothetical protein